MEETFIQSVELGNNRHLDIFDLSRKIAEDTWVVKVTVKMKIDIVDTLFDSLPGVTVQVPDVKKILGDHVWFQVNMERNFIYDSDKDNELNKLIDSFLTTNRAYLSKDTFLAKYVLKEFIKKKKYVH